MNGQDLVDTLKAVLRRKRITYARAASELGMSEANVKRMMSLRRMSLEQLDAFCGILGIDVARLATMTEQRLSRSHVGEDVEEALISDKRRLLMFMLVQQNWSEEAILATFYLSKTECQRYASQLQEMHLIESVAGRWRSRLPAHWRWPAGGPIDRWLKRQLDRSHVLQGNREGEGLSPLLLTLTPAMAERIRRCCDDWDTELRQMAAEDVAPDDTCRAPFLVVTGMRQWNWAPFDDLLRQRPENARKA
jgi:DNA-binding Xre family transcriptional regulator